MSIWGIHNTAIAHGELLGDGSTGFVSVGFDSTPDLDLRGIPRGLCTARSISSSTSG